MWLSEVPLSPMTAPGRCVCVWGGAVSAALSSGEGDLCVQMFAMFFSDHNAPTHIYKQNITRFTIHT